MADPRELQTNLTQYRAQLSQVEAALTTDPENEELSKLKTDLQEIINLTLDLLNVNEKQSSDSDPKGAKWRVGSKCEAIWSQNGSYYPATIDLISDDFTTCTVTFDYGNTEIVKVTTLKDISTASTGHKRTAEEEAASGSVKKISRKEKDQMREQKRKKMARKQQRMKELEEQREGEKNRWLDFFNNSKGSTSSKPSKMAKTLKGVTKKSIFASPETLTGRVGVGTCGVGDKPMTSFSKQDKVVYKK